MHTATITYVLLVTLICLLLAAALGIGLIIFDPRMRSDGRGGPQPAPVGGQ